MKIHTRSAGFKCISLLVFSIVFCGYSKDFNITDYGAIGNGTNLNTEAIQKCIDTCWESGGGRIVVEGGRYVTGTLFLRSNVELHLEANGTLLASPEGNAYPDFICKEWEKERAPRNTSRCWIYVGYSENVSITGMGTLDCNGTVFCDPVIRDGKETGRYIRNTSTLPARMLFVMGCTNVRLEDFTMKNMAGGWGCWINNSQYVTVDKVKMYCNEGFPNSDGIHVNCSCDIMISNCIIHCGDDSIIVRANTNLLKEKRPCERVIVKGCVLSTKCRAIRIGYRNDGIIRNCTFSDLVITDSARGLWIELPDRANESDMSDNLTQISDLRFNNIVINKTTLAPILIQVCPDNKYGFICDIHFSNISAKSGRMLQILGRKDAVIQDIYFNDCVFVANPYSTTSPYPIINFAKGIHFDNTIFTLGYEEAFSEN